MTPLLFALTLGATDADYAATKASIEADRAHLAQRYRAAEGRAARAEVLMQARLRVLRAITEEIVPAWEGTEWAFSGRTDTPQDGAIACGTFVGTVLRDAGFKLNRIRLGRLASEHIALSLTSRANLRRYSNKSAAHVIRDVEAWGPGLYAVGLDNHAGLVWVPEDAPARFLHSSFYGTGGVMNEPLRGDNPFSFSQYRVLAKLLDDRMVRRWLRGHYFRSVKPRSS